MMSKSNQTYTYDYKPTMYKDDYRLIVLIIIIVLLCFVARTKTIEDYERGMDSQSMKDTK